MCALALLALLVARTAAAGTPAPGFVETTAVQGLTVPTAIAFLPDGRFLVTQQSGELILVSGGVASTLASVPVCFSTFDPSFQTETGLLGIAVQDRSIYLYRTRTTATEPCTQDQLLAGQATNEIVRVTLAADDTVDLASLQIVLTGIGAATGYHNGGGLRIGPDEKLYASTGENDVQDPAGPPGSSMNPYAQDLGDLRGKILRLGLDGTPAAGNPFLGQAGARGEIFALGFRNPFRFGFDAVTGALWAGDVGEDTIEEIDRVTAGGNYGWPRCEGTLPPGCAQPGDIPPVFSYPHTGPGALGETVIGGAFPQTGALAAYADRYFFADFEREPGGAVYSVALDEPRTGFAAAPESVVTEAGGPVDVVVGPDGALYYVAYLDGAVRRLAAEGAPPPGACTTIAACATALDAALPHPAAAADGKSRRVARQLAKLGKTAARKLDKAARTTGRKQAKAYRQARAALTKLLATARSADGRGRLGIPLPALETAVNALLALLPAG
jgi:glucose/arabinose dehydrogenase